MSPVIVLGIEAGGTKTVAIAAAEGRLLKRVEFGPGNLRILNDEQLGALFETIATEFVQPAALGVGMAGLRDRADHHRLAAVLAKYWPGVPFRLAHDLETGLRAGPPAPSAKARVYVLSGTGSCCYGRNDRDETAKLGGWGHILGDKGSGYEIGLRALKAIVYYLDRDGLWTDLGKRVLRRLLLNDPNELVSWVQTAKKDEIAGLAIEVFAAAAGGDKIARDILEGAVSTLSKDAVACARRLATRGPVQFVLGGSVLLKQPAFASELGNQIKERWPEAMVQPLEMESAWGAVDLGQEAVDSGILPKVKRVRPKRRSGIFVPPFVPGTSPTEQRNPRTMKLDQLPSSTAVRIFLNEEGRVIPALRRRSSEIVRAVEMVSDALEHGGRLFYIGAGSSGRLGVLDASECPPTFRADSEQIQGIIAGGQRALWQAVEGAEDDAEAGWRAVEFRGVREGDVLVGIAASGRTPFVWGGLAAARKHGAKTILLCFNPSLKIPRRERPDLLVAVDLGPEALTGSTRLKSGTATKLILNLLSTLAMVRLGKVVSNLMVDLNPSNVKLRDRAIRIVRELTGCSEEEAQSALGQSGWRVKEAWKSLQALPASASVRAESSSPQTARGRSSRSSKRGRK